MQSEPPSGSGVWRGRRVLQSIVLVSLLIGGGLPATAADGESSAPLSLVPQSAPPAASTPSQPTPTPIKPTSPVPAHHAAAPPAAAPTVDVRAGAHGTFERLVFTWPQSVPYKVEQQGTRAVITFARAATLNRAGLQSSLPSDIALSSLATTGDSVRLELTLPPGARLRHFATGTKVAVDVVRVPASIVPGDAPKSAVLVPVAGADLPVTVPPPSAKSAPHPADAPATPVTVPGPVPAPSAAAPAPVAPDADAGPVVPERVFSISVSWEKPVAAAVFQRAGYLWIVFDRHQTADTALMHRLGGDAVLSVEQLPSKDATVLRLIVKPEFSPSVRRDGLLWVVDLIDHPNPPKKLIPVVAPATLPSGVGISLSVPDSGSIITVSDPEVGDQIRVVPVIPVGLAVNPGRDSPDVELLPTVQGIAIVPHVDGIDVRTTRVGVTIGTSSGNGLRLSSDAGFSTKEQAGASSAFFNIPAWRRGGADTFDAEEKIVELGLVGIAPARRAMAHLQAARFFFAHGYSAEALGYLRMAAVEDPALVDTGGFRAVRGAAQLMMGQADLAQADLDSPFLKDDAESQLWRAAASAANGALTPELGKALTANIQMAQNYPHALKWVVATATATAATASGDDAAAQQAFDMLDRDDATTPIETSELDYLHAQYEEMQGKFERAIGDYESAAAGDNREYRARALLAETELMLRAHKINAKEAADRLDRMRFAWREENFEFALLKRYAELEREAGDYAESLRALRTLINYYSDNKDVPALTKMMSDIFATLYLEGGADTLPPVTAIGLYDEFRDLTPSGPKGDEMIRKLADRLAAVDLLDRAADLLKHQVDFRLQGLDKARVGAQLAVLDMLNQDPKSALDALHGSTADGLPPDLTTQRRHLEAHALSDLDRVPDAIAILQGDDSTEAALLRAEIYWHKQDWANAATSFEALVPRPDRGVTLDDASSKLVLSWATALVLGNDERGLASLRRNYGPGMEGTKDRDGFTLLTSALDRDVPDLPEIAGKIKEAEGFQSFMTSFRQRLQSSGLSKIN